MAGSNRIHVFCCTIFFQMLFVVHVECRGRTLHPETKTEHDPLQVRTSQGLVVGITVMSPTQIPVDAFLGIPYAKPPLGKYRFKHPQPMDPWTDVFNATVNPPSCIQLYDDFFGDFQGSQMWNPNTPLSEDCLRLNIWVPKPRPRSVPVMVWIYGGGFTTGTCTLDVYDPTILVSEQNLIIVCMNYRVASLGFLYLGGPDAPGNSGLYDQRLALQWIQENIPNFGGDPRKVTLFGESAGAASVTFHLLSPLSRDLFNQAIIQSGTATAPWATLNKRESVNRSLRLAKALGCPHDRKDIPKVIECLQRADPIELVKSREGDLGVVAFPFGPIVDGSFVNQHPRSSLGNKNVKKKFKILIGSNSEEGNYFILYYLSNLLNNTEDVHLSREDFLSSIKRLIPYGSVPIAHEAIAFQYTNWLNPNDSSSNLDALDKIVGDFYFTCGVTDFAMHYATAGNDVYMYYFVHRSTRNPWPKWMGVMHADEINFIFGEPLNPNLGYLEEEKVLSRRMMSYWVNFAQTGNPNLRPSGERESVKWPLHTSQGREYLTLSTNSNNIGNGPRGSQCAFWQQYLPHLLTSMGYSNESNGYCVNGAASKELYPLLLLLVGCVML